jgi:hypothetical protein
MVKSEPPDEPVAEEEVGQRPTAARTTSAPFSLSSAQISNPVAVAKQNGAPCPRVEQESRRDSIILPLIYTTRNCHSTFHPRVLLLVEKIVFILLYYIFICRSTFVASAVTDASSLT